MVTFIPNKHKEEEWSAREMSDRVIWGRRTAAREKGKIIKLVSCMVWSESSD